MDPVPSLRGRTKRVALMVWMTLAVLGTIGVWWFSSYLDSLTVLAHVDREAALVQFRWRVLPVFILLVVVAAVAGSILTRQGMRIARLGAVSASNPSSPPPRNPAIGWILAAAGFLMAAVPLVMLALLFWLIRR